MKDFFLQQIRRLPQPVKDTIKAIRRRIGKIRRQAVNTIRIRQYPGVNLDPIIVYQMGKVGSKTIEQSLIKSYEEMRLRVPIYHVHILNISEWAEENLRNERANPNDTLAVIQAGRELRKQIEHDRSQRWRLVSLVRDPVARNVGTFFHNIHEFIPDWMERKNANTLSIDELQSIFLNIKTIHNEPQWWFDGQIKDVFGVDVFSTSFPREKGYKIYRDAPRTPLLVIRLEDLDRCGSLAIDEFLGIQKIKLINSNIGDEKEYADLYKAFKKRPIPMDYLERIYSTKFTRYFYSDQEIESFIKNWSAHVN